MKLRERRASDVSRLTSNVRLIIFDLDGTLVDAYRAIADSLNHAMKSSGLPTRTLHEVTRAVGWGVDTLIRSFVEEGRAEQALAIFRAHHDKRLRRNIRLLPGAKSILAHLKKSGYALAIASNRPERFCRIILKELGIVEYFDHIICGDGVRRAKPYPDMARAILKRARVQPKEAMFVGDMSVDVLCGKRAGVFTVAIPTGSCTRAEIIAARPDILIERLGELRGILDKKVRGKRGAGR